MQLGRLPMSSAHSMNARKCVHAQKPYPSQAFAHVLFKVGGRGKKERKRDRKDRGHEAGGKKSNLKKKNISNVLYKIMCKVHRQNKV